MAATKIKDRSWGKEDPPWCLLDLEVPSHLPGTYSMRSTEMVGGGDHGKEGAHMFLGAHGQGMRPAHPHVYFSDVKESPERVMHGKTLCWGDPLSPPPCCLPQKPYCMTDINGVFRTLLPTGCSQWGTLKRVRWEVRECLHRCHRYQ